MEMWKLGATESNFHMLTFTTFSHFSITRGEITPLSKN
jgi:hypothetical protein